MTNAEVAEQFTITWNGSVVPMESAPVPPVIRRQPLQSSVAEVLRESPCLLSCRALSLVTGLPIYAVGNQLQRLKRKQQIVSERIEGTPRKVYGLVGTP